MHTYHIRLSRKGGVRASWWIRMEGQVLAGEVVDPSVVLEIEQGQAVVCPLLVLRVFQLRLGIMVPTSAILTSSNSRNDGNEHVIEVADGTLLVKLFPVTGDPSSPPYAPYRDSRSVPVLLVLERCGSGFGSSIKPAKTSRYR